MPFDGYVGGQGAIENADLVLQQTLAEVCNAQLAEASLNATQFGKGSATATAGVDLR